MRFVGAPAPKDVVEAANGSKVDDKSKKETVEGLAKNRFRIILIAKYGPPFFGFSHKNLFSKILPFGFLIFVRKRLCNGDPENSVSN